MGILPLQSVEIRWEGDRWKGLAGMQNRGDEGLN